MKKIFSLLIFLSVALAGATSFTLTPSNDGKGAMTPATPTVVDSFVATTITGTTPARGYAFLKWSLTSGTAIITDTNANPTTIKLTTGATVRANFRDSTSTPVISSTFRPYGKPGRIIKLRGSYFYADSGAVKFGTDSGTIIRQRNDSIYVRVPNIRTGIYNLIFINKYDKNDTVTFKRVYF